MNMSMNISMNMNMRPIDAEDDLESQSGIAEEHFSEEHLSSSGRKVPEIAK
jgi:hypothetical protein